MPDAITMEEIDALRVETIKLVEHHQACVRAVVATHADLLNEARAFTELETDARHYTIAVRDEKVAREKMQQARDRTDSAILRYHRQVRP